MLQLLADWNADYKLLAVVGILVDVRTMTQDQLYKLSSVQNYRWYATAQRRSGPGVA